MRALRPLITPLLLLLALLLMAALGPGEPTMHWFWNRVAARLSWWTAALAVGAALLAMALPRPLPWPLVALLGYAPMAMSPQSGIDTSLYAEYIFHGLRHGLSSMVWEWPERVWRATDGRLHRHMPLVPLAYAAVMRLGLPWRLLTASWSVLLAYATARLGGARAATLLLAVPLLWAQSGLLMVDLPAAALVALAVVGLETRRPLPVLASLLVKSSVGAFLAGPGAVLLLRPWESRRRAALTVALGIFGLAALFALVGHRLRPVLSYLVGLRSLLVHLTPWLLVPAALGLYGGDRRRAWVLAGGLASALVLLRYSPSGHLTRYALPLVPLLCAAAARALDDRRANAIAAFGLVIGLAAYRPLTLHHQAANLAEAIAEVPAGARGIELVAEYDGDGVPPWFLATIAQLDAPARVVYRGPVRPTRRGEGDPERWWAVHPPDPYFLEPIDADYRLVLLQPGAQLPAEPGWNLRSTHDRYQGSSFAFPPRVLLFSREPATSPAPFED